MNFLEIARARQSCRAYCSRPVEQEKLDAILEAVRLAPSACNGQPYHLTVCRGDTAREVAKATMGMGMNKFAAEAAAQGLGTCILGWLDDEKIRTLCGLSRPVRLVVTVGYPADTQREKKRKAIDALVSEVE